MQADLEHDPEALARRRRAADEAEAADVPPWKPPAVAEWIETTQRPILTRWQETLRELDAPKRSAMTKVDYDLAKAEWRCRWSEARIAMWTEVAEALRMAPHELTMLPGGLHYLREAYLMSQAEADRCDAAHGAYVRERARLRAAHAQRDAAKELGLTIAQQNVELALRNILEQIEIEENRHASRPHDAAELARHAAECDRITAKVDRLEQIRAALSEPETADQEPE